MPLKLAIRKAPEEQDEDAISYRIAMRVRCVKFFADSGSYPVCPRCQATMEREYTAYCDRCGQHLSWEAFEKAYRIIAAPIGKRY